MQEVLPEDGVIRKLWAGEAAKYRDHILRLDPESRRNRFAGGVSDDFVCKYVELANSLDAVVYGFFIGDVMRGAAELRPLGCASRARRKRRSASRSAGNRTASAPRCWRACY